MSIYSTKLSLIGSFLNTFRHLDDASVASTTNVLKSYQKNIANGNRISAGSSNGLSCVPPTAPSRESAFVENIARFLDQSIW